MSARLHAWLAARTERERRLLAGAAVVGGALALLVGTDAVGRDLAYRRARIAALEHELATVRRLAARLAPSAGAGVSALARVQAAADAAGLGERVAAINPAAAPADGSQADDVASMRVAGASLAETVRLLHALTEEPAPRVARLAMRKHPDEPTRFDVTLDAALRREP